MSSPQLAWLGLGNMGRGMCKNLVEKGNLSKPLIIHNRTVKRAEELAAKIGNSRVASSITDAASQADILFYCLGDDAAVLSTLDEVLKVDITGKVLVDCSTVHPDTTAKEAQLVEEKGGSFVACPVFGAPSMADAGKLLCVLAGKAEAVDKVKPYTTGVIGRGNIDFSGQAPQKALLLKVLGNTFVLGMVQTLSEGLTAAEITGLGVQELHQFIDTMFGGPFSAYSNRMQSGDYYQRDEPLFAVDLARKDARHAMDLVARAGGRMRQVELADSCLKVVKESQGEKGDIAGIYGAKRLEAGLPFGNQENR